MHDNLNKLNLFFELNQVYVDNIENESTAVLSLDRPIELFNSRQQTFPDVWPFCSQWEVQTSEDFSASLCVYVWEQRHPLIIHIILLHCNSATGAASISNKHSLSAGLKRLSISAPICCWWVFFALVLGKEERKFSNRESIKIFRMKMCLWNKAYI